MPADLDEFARAERGRLLGLAYVLTGSHDQAEDIVQETLTRVLARPPESVCDLGPYVRQAVVNECRSWHRRVIRHRRRERALLLESIRREQTRPDLFTHAEVMDSLDGLPQRQRVAVVLKYLVDLDDAQIAEHLGCAPATVRTLLSRAMRKLRAELTPHQPAERGRE